MTSRIPPPVEDDRLTPLFEAPGRSVEAPPELAQAAVAQAVERRRPDVLWALAAHADRAVAKAAKRGLHLLRSRGVDVEEPARAPTPRHAPVDSESPEPPCYATAVDGFGDRALFLPLRRSQGLALWQAVLSDEIGVRELAPLDVSRKQLRAFMASLPQEGASSVREISREMAAALLAEAISLAPETPRAVDAREILGRLGGGDPSLARPRAAQSPPLENERARLAESASLFDEPELASYVPAEDALRALAVKLDEVLVSPLLLDERQKAERWERTVEQAATDYFTPERRARYARRLFEMSDRFAEDGRREAAERAQAAARQLQGVGELLENPFARRLFSRVFAPAPAREREPEERRPPEPPAAPGGLVLPGR